MSNIDFIRKLLSATDDRANPLAAKNLPAGIGMPSPTRPNPGPMISPDKTFDDQRRGPLLPSIATLGGSDVVSPQHEQQHAFPSAVSDPMAGIRDSDEYQAWENQRAQAAAAQNDPPQTAGDTSLYLPAISIPRQRSMEDELAELDAKQYHKGVWRNPDTGETTSNPNKPGFTEMVKAPGKDRKKKWSTWEKVGAALAGWATGGLAGGIKAATDRNYFSKLGDQFQRERLLPQIAAKQQIEKHEADQELRRVQADYQRARPDIERDKIKQRVAMEKQRFENRMAFLDAQEKYRGERGRREESGDGRVWWRLANGTRIPVEDPDNPGQQEVNPNNKMYDWTDPTSGLTVKIKGSQVAAAGAMIASGNAQRELSAATTNANNQIRVAQDNASRLATWNKQNADLRLKAINEAGKALTNAAELQQIASEMQRVNGQIEMFDPSGYSSPQAAETALAALQKQYDDQNRKFNEALAKTQAGIQIAQALQKVQIPRPEMNSAPRVEAPKIQVPRSLDRLGLFQPRVPDNGRR